jgi:hypothetical protein
VQCCVLIIALTSSVEADSLRLRHTCVYFPLLCDNPVCVVMCYWWALCSMGYYYELWVLFEVKLRPTQPVRLGVRHSSGTRDKFSLLLEIFFRQLRVCYFVAPSLTRGLEESTGVAAGPYQRSPARVWVPRDSRPYFIVPILEPPPTWRARSPYL